MEDKEIEKWATQNRCDFCLGKKMHSCSLYDCEPAVNEAREYAVKRKGKHAIEKTLDMD